MLDFAFYICSNVYNEPGLLQNNRDSQTDSFSQLVTACFMFSPLTGRRIIQTVSYLLYRQKIVPENNMCTTRFFKSHATLRRQDTTHAWIMQAFSPDNSVPCTNMRFSCMPCIIFRLSLVPFSLHQQTKVK